jgi:hypothetical protein
MQTPTIDELHTAIQVLKKLSGHIVDNAANSVMQLPETRLGDQHAARIEATMLEQCGRIEIVTAQLESWRNGQNQRRTWYGSPRL